MKTLEFHEIEQVEGGSACQAAFTVGGALAGAALGGLGGGAAGYVVGNIVGAFVCE